MGYPSTPGLPAAADATFALGEVLSGVYEIRGILGAGGMGQVFEAQDTVLNRRVAIKVAWPEMGEGVIRKEAQALAAIRHPSMVTVYTVGEHRGMEYVVMERIYGVSLEAHLFRMRTKRETLSAREVIELLLAIAQGLVAVHRAGIAHRDVKPANIMLAPGNRVVLMDFGLFLPEFDVAGQATVAGSPQYMSPEAIANEVEPGRGHLVDLYALGVLGFELLAGEAPFVSDLINEVWDMHLYDPVPDIRARRPDVPDRLARLIDELLSKEPSERPQDIDAVVWQLEAQRDERPPAADAPFSVLVVDDDPQIAKVLSFYVKKAAPDADIRVASDGDSALELVRQRAPDVMLLDLQMPRMNGIEVCMYLRGVHLADHCTIVSVSAGAQEHDLQLLSQLGISHFVSKGPGLAEKIGGVVAELRGRVKGKR